MLSALITAARINGGDDDVSTRRCTYSVDTHMQGLCQRFCIGGSTKFQDRLLVLLYAEQRLTHSATLLLAIYFTIIDDHPECAFFLVLHLLGTMIVVISAKYIYKNLGKHDATTDASMAQGSLLSACSVISTTSACSIAQSLFGVLV